ncbi:ead/Ea22-like family protein [Citrobacter koseri]|uniref:ead/Ea22-like family protein n=1 Tax=Citrobacter koseri TaxID=545 RepID=UPI000E11A211|nr:ead/Ea22-like family protein [Citrobacter koseri]MBJ8671413.1 ead/Ea22-like family protein [Citrobacter koseri]MBJ8763671.1 ead/Ea22-like family protein [Citrobacter koseri]MBJ9229081.1 ead/Ea22-like family protein [Citrobacter koseri]SUX97358.1 Uncharacterised protein [Citrobacter koseri]HEM6679519.1 ead/Ea22-like family protein [Citrobacter koseri]
MTIDKQALRQLAEKAISAEGVTWWSEHQLSHEDGLALHDTDAKFIAAATPASVLALLDELEALQSFRTAFNEWHDKTEWVQGDKRFDVIKPWGKHRADVLKSYIDHLESSLKSRLLTNADRDIAALRQRIADQQGIILSARQFISEYAASGDAGADEFVKVIDRAAGIGKGNKYVE